MANGQENMLFDNKGDRLLCQEVMSSQPKGRYEHRKLPTSRVSRMFEARKPT